MNQSNKFSPEVKERAVRLVQEHRSKYSSLWATIESIVPKIGCATPTLHDWVKKHEIDTGLRDGVTSEEREHIKALEREVKELRRANEILKLASAFFAQAELEGMLVAHCTVERLMKRLGLEGVRRGKIVRTTIPNKALPCPLDHVNRQFKSDRPNQLWVSGFTYVSTWLFGESIADRTGKPKVNVGDVAKRLGITTTMLYGNQQSCIIQMCCSSKSRNKG